MPHFTPVDFGPGVCAGFTNRWGGVSQTPYQQLNLGAFVGDNLDDVVENRARVSSHLGAPVLYATQVHGAHVITVDPTAQGAVSWGSEPPITLGSGDAIITETGWGLGVLVADCVPVLLAAPGKVAVAHAGRRGVEQDVIGSAVAALRRTGFDSGAGEIQAAIGPAICGQCYEVPAAMRDEVALKVPAAWTTTARGTPGLDLPAAVESQLTTYGVSVVYRTEICSYENDNYFSHRRAALTGGTTGRQAGVIRLTTGGNTLG